MGYAPGPDNPNYLNLALAIEAACEPLQLLGLAHAIEAALGRERSVPNAPRTIDIDLLACGGIMYDGEGLALPHPRLWERQFVVAPLADIAPEFTTGGPTPARALVDPDDPAVRKLGPLGDLVRSSL